MPNRRAVLGVLLAAPLAAAAPSRTLACAGCAAAIAPAEAATSRNGAHTHTRSSPMGKVYEFGCFTTAPGVTASGAPTAYHTWFAGYRWRVVSCRTCQLQLGWRFDGAGDAFYGLIPDRLQQPGRPTG